MLKKKDYKKQDHFINFRSVTIPQINGNKIMVYYKRYNPRGQGHQLNLYSIMANKASLSCSQYPIDRTLELISFDKDLQSIYPYMRKIGRIRKYHTGNTIYNQKKTYYAIIVYKFQYDLLKCYKEDYLQQKINELKPRITNEEQQIYNSKIINKYLKEQLIEKNRQLQTLRNDGFTPIYNKFGEFKVNKNHNGNQNQKKKKRKLALPYKFDK